MENGIKTLEDLFKTSNFTIPQYQRAYSWGEAQLSQFVEDLRQQVVVVEKNPKKSYFLGSLLLHEVNDNEIHVVDGQQRLTTSVIFIAAALCNCSDEVFAENGLKKTLLKRTFINDEEEETQKLKTITEDNPYFRSDILGIGGRSDSTEGSPSARRIKFAFDYFSKNINSSEWSNLLKILKQSNVMVYSVNSSEDATQIFEFQNDRGKKLTDLESLKSYLMHTIYLYAKNPNDDLETIQEYFAKIYRNIEKQSKLNWIPKEDAVLSYYAVSYLSWKDDEWRHPKALVKSLIKQMDESEIKDWVNNFAQNLCEFYQKLSEIHEKIVDFPILSELLILNRMATFWPLIIKGYKLDKDSNKRNFNKMLRLMEVYAFRGYGLSNLRSDSGLSNLYSQAKNFDGDFEAIFDHIFAMCSWYDVETRYLQGINSVRFYSSYKNEARYILWQYENHLRSLKGQQHPLISWNDYMNPSDDARKLNIEHIAAQSNSISFSEVKWDDSDEIKKFSDVATHRIGNLVIDSTSSNSKKGCKDFSEKLADLSQSIYLSQSELITIAKKHTWGLSEIKERQETIVKFVVDKWSPKKYHQPIKENLIEEDSE